MRKKKLLWQLYSSYIFIVLISLFVITCYATESLKEFYMNKTVAELKARAYMVGNHINNHFSVSDTAYVDKICKDLGKLIATRITVILPSGKVIGDTDQNPQTIGDHSSRSEVVQAKKGVIGKSIRYSSTIKTSMIYIAVPFIKDKKLLGIVRASLPITSVDKPLSIIFIQIILGGLIVAVIAAGISLYISRKITKPLEELEIGARKFADGDLGFRLPVSDSTEIGGLAKTMNEMAAQLDDRMTTITRQHNEREAVFSSMVEGVIAIDKNKRIIIINKAAAQLIGVNQADVLGLSVQEVINNNDLQEYVSRALSNHHPDEEDNIFCYNDEKYIKVYSTALKNVKGTGIGAIIVLDDVTRIRQLENIRRDFVANVSHELKTPITSIKGFVETLLDGALEEPDDARRFLEIIRKHADRLNAIINDLLSLSRIEQETEKVEIQTENTCINEVIKSAVQVCEIKAEEKSIKVEFTCENNIYAKVEPSLFEQALVNLIDNAVKYSEIGSFVRVEAFQNNQETIIRVCDNGCGISKEHLSRLFERFYRVDKARSRKLGGTGLGLAIVKHIALAHNGYVHVESTPGEGSIFSIHIP